MHKLHSRINAILTLESVQYGVFAAPHNHSPYGQKNVLFRARSGMIDSIRAIARDNRHPSLAITK